MSGENEERFVIEGREDGAAPPAAENTAVPPAEPQGSPASEPIEPQPDQPSALWPLVPVLLFLLGAASVILTQRQIGYAWDESFYYEPARDAAIWVVDTITGERPLSAKTIDQFWEERHEHPSFHKLLSGFSLYFLEKTPAIGPLMAMRLPIALLFGASLVLMYGLGRAAWGPVGGAVSALALLAMPRVFGHAHFSSMETPLIFSILLTVFCFLRGLESRVWAVATGFALGLLLATKINGFFLIPPLILWGYLYAGPKSIHNFVAMALIAPLVFVGLWPWLWPDPVSRVLEYLTFHAEHQQTALWFLNQKWGYGDELAPWFYPSVMIGVTLPLSVLALSAIGMLSATVAPKRRAIAGLYLLIGLVMWGVASAPGTPKYDGVRLFLPVFPFIALLAGGGAVALVAGARWMASSMKEPALQRRTVRLAAWGIAVIVIAEGALASYAYYPYLLSYFNPIVGGLEGAKERGFEVTYWGEAVNDDVLAQLNEGIPDGASLKVLALHELNFQHLQRWGKLKSTIRIGGPPPYYAHLLLMRRGFFARPETALADSSRFFPLATWKHGDVTMLALYSTGETFEQYWRTLGPLSPPVPAVPDVPAE